MERKTMLSGLWSWALGADRDDRRAALQPLVDRVVIPSDDGGCPLCAAELATRAVLPDAAAVADRGQPGRPADFEPCPVHEAWLAARVPGACGPGLDPARASGPPEPIAARGPGRRPVRRARAPECALCGLEWMVAERAARMLVARLDDSAERARYAAGPGLCVRHLEIVAARASPDLRRFLADLLTTQLESLHAELAEFFRKGDYRFQHEPRGAEQTAWRRAIARLVGAPELALLVHGFFRGA